MNRVLRRAFWASPWLFGAVLPLSAGEAQAAPRGSVAWCEQMMDRPVGMWSLNDHGAFDSRCKKQRAAQANSTEITEDDKKFVARMFEDRQPPAKPIKAAPQPAAATQGASGTSSTPDDQEAAFQAKRAADRVKYQHYLDTHSGNGASSSSPASQSH